METIKRIRELAEQGATVVFMDNYPSDVPGLSHLEERRTRFSSLMKEFPQVTSFAKVSKHPLGKGEILTGNSYRDILSHCGTNEAFVSED